MFLSEHDDVDDDVWCYKRSDVDDKITSKAKPLVVVTNGFCLLSRIYIYKRRFIYIEQTLFKTKLKLHISQLNLHLLNQAKYLGLHRRRFETSPKNHLLWWYKYSLKWVNPLFNLPEQNPLKFSGLLDCREHCVVFSRTWFGGVVFVFAWLSRARYGGVVFPL